MMERGVFEEIMYSHGFEVLKDYEVKSRNLEKDLIRSILGCSSDLENALCSILLYKKTGDMSEMNTPDKNKLIISYAYINEALAFFSLKANEHNIAYNFAKKAADFNSDCADKKSYLHYVLGRSYHELKRFENGSKELEQSLASDSGNVHAMVLLGMCYDTLGEFTSAEEEFLDSVTSSIRGCKSPQPDDIDFIRHYETAMFYHRNDVHEEAAKMFEECIRLKPQDAVLYAKAEFCYEGMDKDAEALQCIRYGLMHCPDSKALQSIEQRLRKKLNR